MTVASPSASPQRPSWLQPIHLVATAFLVYGLAFIASSSFVVDGQRYFGLLDDALISMRYGRNLMEGHGLVWNPGGERVEGITNPLWTVLMGLLHLAPVSLHTVPLLVQLTSLALLLLNLVVLGRLAECLGGSRLAGLIAAVLTGFYLPLNTWALLGMEVGALALLVSLAVLSACRALRGDTFCWRPHLVLALATLVRMDAVVPWAALTAALVLQGRASRRQHLVAAAGLASVALGGQVLARLAYYGELLPNTYYLKVSGVSLWVRLAAGLPSVINFVLGLGLLAFLVPLLLALLSRQPARRLVAAVVLAQVAYTVYIGGDMFDMWPGANRFLCVVIPLLFCLVGLTVVEAVELLVRGASRPVSAHTQRLLALGLGAAILVDANDFAKDSLAVWALSKELHLTGAARAVTQHVVLVEELTEPTASVGVTWAGIVPYYTNRPGVDLLGKSDKPIARQTLEQAPVDLSKEPFWPGHMKWDYARSIGQLQPDVITQLWSLPVNPAYLNLLDVPPEAAPYLKGRYVRARFGDRALLLRKDSPAIRWQLVRESATHLVELR